MKNLKYIFIVLVVAINCQAAHRRYADPVIQPVLTKPEMDLVRHLNWLPTSGKPLLHIHLLDFIALIQRIKLSGLQLTPNDPSLDALYTIIGYMIIPEIEILKTNDRSLYNHLQLDSKLQALQQFLQATPMQPQPAAAQAQTTTTQPPQCTMEQAAAATPTNGTINFGNLVPLVDRILQKINVSYTSELIEDNTINQLIQDMDVNGLNAATTTINANANKQAIATLMGPDPEQRENIDLFMLNIKNLIDGIQKLKTIIAAKNDDPFWAAADQIREVRKDAIQLRHRYNVLLGN